MASSGKYPLMGKVEVDETVVGEQEEGVIGRQNNRKRQVLVAIEKKGRGVSRMYARIIDNAGTKQLKPFSKIIYPVGLISKPINGGDTCP